MLKVTLFDMTFDKSSNEYNTLVLPNYCNLSFIRIIPFQCSIEILQPYVVTKDIESELKQERYLATPVPTGGIY